MKVLLKVSGSVSAYKLCEVVSYLKKNGHQVKVAASKASLNFVGAATWEALSGHQVFVDDFAPNQRMDHIYLNDWADVVVLAPATAKTLNQIGLGVGDGVLNTLFLARKLETPYLVFPAMNPRMWEKVLESSAYKALSELKSVKIFEPNSGAMACGHEGAGRLRESFEILDEILKFDVKTKKVLITLGGTKESIDGVRHIGNFSTGKTGKALIQKLKTKYEVTALISKEASIDLTGLEGVRRCTFSSSKDLENLIKEQLESNAYESFFHLAAVSDYLPEEELAEKMSSSEETLNLRLRTRSKILNSVRAWSKNKNLNLISFKLTHGQNEDEVADKILKQFDQSSSDFIVHNELLSSRAQKHDYKIWSKKEKTVVASGSTKDALALDVLNLGV